MMNYELIDIIIIIFHRFKVPRLRWSTSYHHLHHYLVVVTRPDVSIRLPLQQFRNSSLLQRSPQTVVTVGPGL
jgi:hypothetical protein